VVSVGAEKKSRVEFSYAWYLKVCGLLAPETGFPFRSNRGRDEGEGEFRRGVGAKIG